MQTQASKQATANALKDQMEQAQRIFLDTVATYGPLDKASHAALDQWGWAKEAWHLAEYEATHTRDGFLIRHLTNKVIDFNEKYDHDARD